MTQISWYDRAGRKLESITKPGEDQTIRFSRDEKKLAFSRRAGSAQSTGSDIWILDLARGAFPDRLTSEPGDEIAPIWSPDGSQIIYSDTNGKINRKAANGPATAELVLTANRAIAWDWSSDGRFLAYYQVGSSSNTGDLWVLPLFGDRKPISFLQTKFDEVGPQFSPDGRWISYTSDEAGTYDVYVRPFPNSDRQFRISVGGGRDAQWRADGKELFYIAPGGKIMAVDIKTSPEFGASVPKSLFEPRILGGVFGAYAVTHDGQRFLINETVETAANPNSITILTNWTATMKK